MSDIHMSSKVDHYFVLQLLFLYRFCIVFFLGFFNIVLNEFIVF